MEVASKMGVMLMWNEDDSILVRTTPEPDWAFRDQS